MTKPPAIIPPRVLRGFRDHLPESMLAREWLVDTARGVYRSYGFAPIDTPALEYEEILLGKGGEESDRQIYAFEDQGGRRVAMRFDLTVPLARFVAQHAAELGKPFKRYHIGLVWRGEKSHRGRYREFLQCDFDTIGTESIAADAETGLVIHDLLDTIGVGEFTIRVNDRRVLSGLLERLDLAEQTVPVLRALDKLAKVGEQGVLDELQRVGVEEARGRDVLRLAQAKGSNEQVLASLAPLVAGSQRGEAGLAALRELAATIEDAGVSPGRLVIDPSIARGLDYYTGTVYETFLDDLPEIGSVCSGGRYDDLASLYTKQRLPGIGASLGLDRLLAALEELGRLRAPRTAAPVFLAWFAHGRLADYERLARVLRASGIGVELYPEPRKLGKQLEYANKKGFRFAVIVGEDEWERGEAQVKDLASGKAETVSLEGEGGLAARLRERLAAAGWI